MSKMKWAGRNVAVLATGPSLNKQDVVAVRDAGFITLAVNHAWLLAPWCDVIYAGDARYWRAYGDQINNCAPNAKKYSRSANAQKLYGAVVTKTVMKGDYNSGQLAIEYALRQHPDLIVLLGFDASLKDGIHFHGPHDKTPNPRKSRMKTWALQFQRIPKHYDISKIVNCSRKTALTVFRQDSLENVLNSIS